MTTVWVAFGVTAATLALGALIAMRSKGVHASALQASGRWLLVMAIGTAVYPVLLRFLGLTLWIVGYIVFVVAVAALMTGVAIAKDDRVDNCTA